MKLYQYDDLKKANQALGSFKRNGIPVLNVSEQVVEGKVVFFVLTDPEVKDFEEEAKPNGKKEKKAQKAKASTKEAKPEPKVGEPGTDSVEAK